MDNRILLEEFLNEGYSLDILEETFFTFTKREVVYMFKEYYECYHRMFFSFNLEERCKEQKWIEPIRFVTKGIKNDHLVVLKDSNESYDKLFLKQKNKLFNNIRSEI